MSKKTMGLMAALVAGAVVLALSLSARRSLQHPVFPKHELGPLETPLWRR